MLGASDYEQAIHAVYMTGIAANWTAEKFKEATDIVKEYYEAVGKADWKSLTKEIGTVSGVFFTDPRQDTYDRIKAAGEAANKTEPEISAEIDLYDDVETAKVFKNMLDSIANTGFGALISELELVGEAMGEGATAGQAFAGSMRNIVVAIVEALPQLLLSAGLELLSSKATMGLGLGLIAASGILSLTSGYMSASEGTTTESNTVSFNAKGNAFDRGRILSSPTFFSGSNGLNVAGEAGTDAVLPLSRDASGKLGVNVNGSRGGANVTVPVTVSIVNQTGVEAETEVTETTDSNGMKSIEVLIKKVVKNGMATGEYDRTMKSRYGLSNKGVS